MITSFTLTSLSYNFTIPSYSIQTTLKPILKEIWTKHAVMEDKEKLVNSPNKKYLILKMERIVFSAFKA